MPLYEYYCQRCEGRFEVLRPASDMDEPATCPSGHVSDQRVLSTFAAFTQSEGSDEPLGGGGCACSAGGTCACSAGSLN